MPEILIFEIPIQLELSDTSAANVNATVEQAVSESIAAAQLEYEVRAEPEVQGAFGGVGETIVVLTIIHLLKAGGIEVAKGALGAAGAAFVNKYLLPRLRALNLLPGRVTEPRVTNLADASDVSKPQDRDAAAVVETTPSEPEKEVV